MFPEERYFSDGYFYLWNIFSKEILEDIFLKNICFNIYLKRIFDTNICLAYDEKAHAAKLLYMEDSDPNFIHQLNSIELSLLGFQLCFICEPVFVSPWCIEQDL